MSSRVRRARRLQGRASVPAAASPAFLTIPGRCGAFPSIPPDTRRITIVSASGLVAPVPPVLALPDLDVVIVLRQGLGEDVGAVVAANEVDVGDVRRSGGGLQAGEPRRADGARWEAGPAVGVVGRIHPQIVARQVAVPPAELLERVDDRGVRRQADLLVEAVLVDG